MNNYIEIIKEYVTNHNYSTAVYKIELWLNAGDFSNDDIFYGLKWYRTFTGRGEDHWNVPLLF